MPATIPKIQMLQASSDENDESYFRFLINHKFVRYITIGAGLYTIDDMWFAPALLPLLPAFHAGDWNNSHIARHPETGQPGFAKVTKQQLPGVECIWHATHVDHLELVMGGKLRSNVYEATCSRF